MRALVETEAQEEGIHKVYAATLIRGGWMRLLQWAARAEAAGDPGATLGRGARAAEALRLVLESGGRAGGGAAEAQPVGGLLDSLFGEEGAGRWL